MVSVGSVTVDVIPDARNFDQTLAAKLNPAAVRAGDEYGKRYAEALQARLKASNPSLAVDADTGKARVEVDRFLADTKLKTAAASRSMGNDSGSQLATGMRTGIMGGSPLIVSAIAGGLIAGAPLVLGAAGVLFGGVAAVAVHSNAQVQAAFAATKTTITSTLTDAAQVTVPAFVDALGRIGTAVHGLGPQLHDAFGALTGPGGPIASLTTGFIGLIQNAMPGLVSALKAAGPVFQGISDMLSRIGTGLGQFFALVSQHGSAAGQVFSSIGKIVQELLPILGQLVGAGVELGSQILPVLASVLGVVAKVLNAIAPVLPVVVGGFLALRVASALAGPMDALAGKLSNLGSVGQAAGGTLSKIGNSLPLIGIGFTLLGTALDGAHKDADNFRTSAEQLYTQLGQGGVAAGQAQAKLALLQQAASHPPPLNGWFSDSLSTSLGKGKQAAADAEAAMGPLAQAQQKVTQAQNDYLAVMADPNHTNKQAADAAGRVGSALGNLNSVQGQLNSVTSTAAGNMANLKGNLQLTADAASQANSEIGLLKGGLDALTGANVTLDQAQIAVTQSEDAITQAVKGHSAALVFNNGVLDLSNAGSAQASQMLIQLGSNMHQQIATMQESGASTDTLNKQTDNLRQQFILQAEQLGATAAEAKTLADRYFGVPGDVHTQITGDASQANGVIDAIQARINQLMTDHTVHLSAIVQTGNMIGGLGFNAAKATGGPVTGPGSGTSDTAGLFALSNGEHVWTAAETAAAGGHAAVEALRANALTQGRGLAGGGRVGLDRINVSATDTGFGAAVGAMDQSIWQAANQIAAGASTGGSGGAARWAGLVLQALSIMGQPASLLGSVLRRMNQESGGNPMAINLWDSNAAAGDPSRGLMQVIGSTFARYHHGGTSFDIYDPMANVLASMDYAIARYGSLSAAYNRAGGYALGTNYVPSDQLALLHKGEAVVPASANQGAPWQGGEGMRIVGTLDLGGGLEGRIDARVVQALDLMTARGSNNPR